MGFQAEGTIELEKTQDLWNSQAYGELCEKGGWEKNWTEAGKAEVIDDSVY